MKYDLRCTACDTTHVHALPGDHATGDRVSLAHVEKTGACGEYAPHEVVAVLDGGEV